MVADINHRRCSRIDHNVRFLYKDASTGECHPVRILNYSDNGVYFESLHCLPPGTEIHFYSRGGKSPENASNENFRSFKPLAKAVVKWCSNLENREYPYFGIGTEYIE
jgi:hypothetical protein